MKLDKIISKQEEHSLLLRQLLQTREEDTGPENPIPSIGQLPDLLSFEDKLRGDEELQRKMVKNLTFLFEAELNCMHRVDNSIYIKFRLNTFLQLEDQTMERQCGESLEKSLHQKFGHALASKEGRGRGNLKNFLFIRF